MGFREWLLEPVIDLMERVERKMADVSADLNEVATGLSNMQVNVASLLQENANLRSRNAELEGEDVAESAAAANVVSSFNALASQFSDVPEVSEPAPEA